MQHNTSIKQRYETTEWSLATDHAECVVCFEPLQSEQCCVLVNNTGTRVCQHIFHFTCAEDHKRSLGESPTCAICRRSYSSLKKIPDFQSDPEAWFEIVDLDGDGQLSLKEVTEILKYTTPLDWKTAESWIRDNWMNWDTDGDGHLSFAEIVRPGTGLLHCLRDIFDEIHRGPVPELDISTLRDWFVYWDEDNSKELDKEEVIRALIKTLSIGHDSERQASVREVVNGTWAMFDSDGNGNVDIDEFILPDGLGETLIATIR
mmetsp:Transcript_7634/g.8809  ORF Transcript_7634/g.8809 Transcript_7634/m.8809 type:complete len:261 (+) Transcript_7634:63-845(+)